MDRSEIVCLFCWLDDIFDGEVIVVDVVLFDGLENLIVL